MNRTEELEKKIKNDIFRFFSDQCEVEPEKLSDATNIIEDLDGDSLMFLQMLEGWKKEYTLDIDFRVIGKYLTKHPIETLGNAVQFAYTLIFDGEKIKASLE
jgi:acyl carrier protein